MIFNFSKYLFNESIKVRKYPYTLLFTCLIPFTFFIYTEIYFSDFLAIYSSWRDEHPDGSFNEYFNQTFSIYTDLWYTSIAIAFVIFVTEIDAPSSFFKRLLLLPVSQTGYLLTKATTITFLYLFQIFAAYFILRYELNSYTSYFNPKYSELHILACLLVRLVVCIPIFLLLIFLYIANKTRITVFTLTGFLLYIITSFILYTPFNILKNTQFDINKTDMILSLVISIIWFVLFLLISPIIISILKKHVEKSLS